MPNNFKFDIFLSHSTADKAIVRKLAARLRRDGLRVWFDEWEIRPGDMIGRRIEEGLESARVLVLCMSRHAFASEWTALESGTFRFRDPTNKERRFIPIRLDDTEIKDALRQFAYIDLRRESEEEYQKLASASRLSTIERGLSELGRNEIIHSKTLAVRRGVIRALAMTPDGRKLITGSGDGRVMFWDVGSTECLRTFTEHTEPIVGVAISPDGMFAVSSSADGAISVWDLDSTKCIASWQGFRGNLQAVANTPEGRCVFSTLWDTTIALSDVTSGQHVESLIGHTATVLSVAAFPSGKMVISGSEDCSLRIWDLSSRKTCAVLTGHTDSVFGVALAANGLRAVSCSADTTLKLWDVAHGNCVATLEGHTATVREVAITPDGRWAVSGADDQTVKLWNLRRGTCVGSFPCRSEAVLGVQITPDRRRIISFDYDRKVAVLEIKGDKDGASEESGTSRYTNAKVLLVGDSGVGKTGLASRLTENRFVPSVSTDAAWASQMKLPFDSAYDNLDREIWLWDFAGQADYRLIHQLYMDEAALAVLVFNPQSESPYEGLGQWEHDLQRAARRRLKKLLVAGRCDRGGLMVSRDSIERFRCERSFEDFIETSALTGMGCDALRDAIIRHISWGDIPWTASPRIFKLLKEAIVRLKDEGMVLLRMAELKQQLELKLSGDDFTLDQLRAVVALLAGPGVVCQLEFGDFVLLQPGRINAYASAVIRSVRAHTEEIGCIAEEDVLAGKLDYQDMKRLPRDEEQIVLRAMHQTFVDHGLCLREHTDKGTLLIFPSYFKRERPDLEKHPLVLVTYQFNGSLDEIYATLIVRIHHTTPFEKDRLWRFAADFKTHSGKRLGLKMTKKGEGAGEMEVYFEPGIANDVQVTFIRYVHEHLKLKAQDVRRIRHYVCPHCHTPVENSKAVEKRLVAGKTDILCGVCEKRVKLVDLIEEQFASDDFLRRVRELDDLAKAAIDNESRELILVGHTYAIAGEAGQIYRQYTNSDHGIDGEIEFKDSEGKASGQRVYLQLKSGDSYLYHRERDGAEIFKIKNERHVAYWQQQSYPVMLVIRTSDEKIRWMDISDYLKRESKSGKSSKQIVFKGEPFTALSLRHVRDKFVSQTIASQFR